MNVVKRAISIPVWFDTKRIYVPSADIPRGEWVLLLTLMPIENSLLVLTENSHRIEEVKIETDKTKLEIKASRQYGIYGWQIFFHNRLKGGDPPYPVQYNLGVSGFPKYKGKKKNPIHPAWRDFDPVVIAQPDPIYP